jgi:hypothetical protein
MAYDTKELIELSFEAIKKHKLFFIEDLVAYLPCSSRTFYNHDLHNMQELKDLVATNRIITKRKLQRNWEQSENATLQMGLMKMIASIEERQRLSQTYNDITTKGESLNYTDEEREKMIAELLKERGDVG